MKRIAILSLTVFVFACSGSTKYLIPTQADADRVTSKYPGMTLDQLSEGHSLYKKNCKLCHGLKNPSNFNEAKLTKVVPGMVKMAKEKGSQINDDQQALLLKYLVTMSGS